jgi:hypothetical protein
MRWPGFAAGLAVGAAALSSDAYRALADPTMTVGTYYETDPELGFGAVYIVTNTTPGSNPDDNMISFTLPAGSNLGVYDALPPRNWGFQIELDNTYFWTDTTPILPGGQKLFELYSNLTNVGQDYAQAMSEYNGPFVPVLVVVPRPFPSCETFTSCMTGPGTGEKALLPPECQAVDFDADGDVDLLDFKAFQIGAGAQ